ncbi:M17 family peptidase N-terminal domain-containing protein [Criblamydia sequanensis]|nr:M17 family peptidase N-terminal domain-containing protein [Criblamydia sequanensis]
MAILFKVFVIALIFVVTGIAYYSGEKEPALNTKETLGQFDGVEIEAVVQSPSLQKTPLQIICLFEYEEGDIFNSPPALPKEKNGLVHVDLALNGLITDLRKSNQFEGKWLETLLITPPKNTIAAEKLMLIGLGPRRDFKPEIMRMVGVVGMREALRIKVESYSHASDLKDAGIDSSTGEVAGLVIKGALEAYKTQKNLFKQDASETLTVIKIALLTGQAFFEASREGIKSALLDY